MSGDVTTGSDDDGDYDAAAVSEIDTYFNLYSVFFDYQMIIVI